MRFTPALCLLSTILIFGCNSTSANRDKTNALQRSEVSISKIEEESSIIDVYSIVIDTHKSLVVDYAFRPQDSNRVQPQAEDVEIVLIVELREPVFGASSDEGTVLEISAHSQKGINRFFGDIETDRDTSSLNVDEYIQNIRTGRFELQENKPFKVGTFDLSGDRLNFTVSVAPPED